MDDNLNLPNSLNDQTGLNQATPPIPNNSMPSSVTPNQTPVNNSGNLGNAQNLQTNPNVMNAATPVDSVNLMNNQANNVPVPTADLTQNPVEPKVSSDLPPMSSGSGDDEQKKQKAGSKLKLFPIILLLLVMFLVGAGIAAGIIFLLEKDTNQSSDNVNENENSQDVVDEDTKEEERVVDDNTAKQGDEDWKVYKNDEYKVTFSYPSDWVVTEDTPPDEAQLVVVAKNKGYEFLYTIPYPDFGGSVCLYGEEPSDEDAESVPFSSEYIELDKGGKQYRRAQTIDSLIYGVCEGDEGTFGNVIYMGFVNYHSPTENASTSSLETMDKIFLSLKREGY